MEVLPGAKAPKHKLSAKQQNLYLCQTVAASSSLAAFANIAVAESIAAGIVASQLDPTTVSATEPVMVHLRAQRSVLEHS